MNREELEAIDPSTLKENLTEKEEIYCQLRAKGYTKTDAAKGAFDTVHPSKLAYTTELKPHIVYRIWQLREELKEISNIDEAEQIRRYNALYMECLKMGKLELAKRMLERIDKILGFESPTKTINIKSGNTEAFKDLKGDVAKDVAMFKNVLEKHSKKPPEPKNEDKSIH